MGKTWKWEGLSSFGLHLLAMGCMLCDHTWAMGRFPHRLLTCIGRIAFPIFAFMAVEGYFRTHDLKKYGFRLLMFALLSEIPFDLFSERVLGNPSRQNVLWTLLLGLSLVHWVETAKKRNHARLTALVSLAAILVGGIVGNVTKADYADAGVLTVLVFYFFRGEKWWCRLGQLAGLHYVNSVLRIGYVYPISIFGHAFALSEQSLALLSLIPIWLYRGKQGYHAKWFRYFCYAFYPVHMLILFLLWRFR